MIKYINIYKEDARKSEKHPTHKLVIVNDDDSKQYIGVVWYSDTKGFGSVNLQEGVEIKVSDQVKKYYKSEKTEKPKKAEEKKVETFDDPIQGLDYGDPIDPSMIPF